MMAANWLHTPYSEVLQMSIHDVDLATELRTIIAKVAAAYSPPE
jgi:hypothetical protein